VAVRAYERSNSKEIVKQNRVRNYVATYRKIQTREGKKSPRVSMQKTAVR
jgi:hypothetical protein